MLHTDTRDVVQLLVEKVELGEGQFDSFKGASDAENLSVLVVAKAHPPGREDAVAICAVSVDRDAYLDHVAHEAEDYCWAVAEFPDLHRLQMLCQGRRQKSATPYEPQLYSP